MKLKENELQKNSTGFSIKTTTAKLDIWKQVITKTLKVYGYRYTRLKDLKDATQLAFEKGACNTYVNVYKNGTL